MLVAERLARRWGATATQRRRMIALLCRDGQRGGATLGIEGVFDQFARFAFATPAARGAARAGLHVFERARAARDGPAEVLIGNGLADADVHGAFFAVTAQRAPLKRECE